MGVTKQKPVDVPQVQIIDKTVEVPVQKQMQVPMVTKVQKEVDVPQIEIVDRHIHIPVQKHRHVPVVQKIQKNVEVTVIETVEKIVDVPVVKQVEVPQIQTIEKIVEVPYIQTMEKIVEVPQVGETVQGVQKHMTIELETVRQEAPVETIQEVVTGPPLPAEAGQTIVIDGGAASAQFYGGGAQVFNTMGQQMAMTGPASSSVVIDQQQLPTTYASPLTYAASPM